MTGKTKLIHVLGRELLFFNQRCRDWTHPYPYQNDENLSNAGCGVFGLCHCIEWLTGQRQSPEYWADFSCANGGRGDDGTDRPALLAGLMASGDAQRLSFRYDGDGLRNDLETLWPLLLEQKCVSLCNLRVGHIVALVAAREVQGDKQVLAIDSYSESARDNVRNAVREVIPGSEINYDICSSAGMPVGAGMGYAAFWVSLNQVKDYNILHRI